MEVELRNNEVVLVLSREYVSQDGEKNRAGDRGKSDPARASLSGGQQKVMTKNGRVLAFPMYQIRILLVHLFCGTKAINCKIYTKWAPRRASKNNLAPLKENLKYLLKKHHKGRAKSITLRDLALELIPIRANIREIRESVKELGLEGVPIMLTLEPPGHVHFAVTESEMWEWTDAMLDLCEEICRKKRDIESALKMRKEDAAEA